MLIDFSILQYCGYLKTTLLLFLYDGETLTRSFKEGTEYTIELLSTLSQSCQIILKSRW